MPPPFTGIFSALLYAMPVRLHSSGRQAVVEQKVSAGDVITMQAGCRHTVFADTELKLIEVQLGQNIHVGDKKKYELEL